MKSCVEMEQPRKKLEEQWRKRHTEIKRREEEKEEMNTEQQKQENIYVKKQEKTHIMQLIKQSPEIPEIIELNRERDANSLQR